jgi:FkbM family methyltransferase
MRAPLRLGKDRALVRLDSGEYVCVDTNSIDAIDYLLGWPMEADYLPVFRTLLTPRSVVLDIGANFGLYTAVAGRIAGEHGRVYAFEGNPHTFRLLLRTLYANRLIYNPNIVSVNMLVSKESGRGTLHYYEEALGGATMSEDERWPGERRSVEVAMTTIDDYLPVDRAVDLVKIDVEGHEPFVILGMEKTIRRSPNIRLLIEYYEPFLAHTMPGGALLDMLRTLGLTACKVMPYGHIEPIAAGDALHGSGCWLLTRTPEADRDLLRRRLDPMSLRLRRRASRIWRALVRRRRARP